MSGSKVTVREIALAAGVSIGTVSRALKGQPGLSDETRSQVLRVAQSMRYDTNRLRSGKPRRILFLYGREIPSVAANRFYSVVLHGAETACREAGVSLSLLSVAAGDDIERQVRRHEADALLVMGHLDQETMSALRACDLPLALTLHHHPGLRCINDDNVHGALLATRHLIEGGAQRPALIVGPLGHHAMTLRAKGFRRALFEAGVLADPELEVELDVTLDYDEAGRAAMRRLLALEKRPDAVFVYNDATALNAIAACVEAGVRVPQDIRFVGYDDLAIAARSKPSLTSVRVDKEALGRDTALALIDGLTEPGETLLPVELVVRDSSATITSRAATRQGPKGSRRGA